MTEPLSSLESALLHAFRKAGARVGDPVPTGILTRSAFGYAAPTGAGEVESALLNLEFRGLIAPGPDPLSATTWMLTPAGDHIAGR